MHSGIFSQMGLDRFLLICPTSGRHAASGCHCSCHQLFTCAAICGLLSFQPEGVGCSFSTIAKRWTVSADSLQAEVRIQPDTNWISASRSERAVLCMEGTIV